MNHEFLHDVQFQNRARAGRSLVIINYYLVPCIILHRDLMCKQPFPLYLRVCCFFAALCPSLVVASHGYNHLSLPCTSLDPGRINTRVFQRVGAVALFFRILAFHESECWSSSIGKMKFDC